MSTAVGLDTHDIEGTLTLADRTILLAEDKPMDDVATTLPRPRHEAVGVFKLPAHSGVTEGEATTQ